MTVLFASKISTVSRVVALVHVMCHRPAASRNMDYLATDSFRNRVLPILDEQVPDPDLASLTVHDAFRGLLTEDLDWSGDLEMYNAEAQRVSVPLPHVIALAARTLWSQSTHRISKILGQVDLGGVRIPTDTQDYKRLAWLREVAGVRRDSQAVAHSNSSKEYQESAAELQLPTNIFIELCGGGKLASMLQTLEYIPTLLALQDQAGCLYDPRGAEFREVLQPREILQLRTLLGFFAEVFPYHPVIAATHAILDRRMKRRGGKAVTL